MMSYIAFCNTNKSIEKICCKDMIDPIPKDTINRTVHYLDGVKTPIDTILKYAQHTGDGTFFPKGYTDPREAIKHYGEKYRYGVLFFYTSKRRKN